MDTMLLWYATPIVGFAIAAAGLWMFGVRGDRRAREAAELAFELRQTEALEARQREIELESDLNEELVRAAFLRVVHKHRQALRRTARQSMFKDAYGHWVHTALRREMRYFVENVFLKEAPEITGEALGLPPAQVVDILLENVTEVVLSDFLDAEMAGIASEADPVERNDGLGYERSVADRLAALGYSVTFTPRSGDQGVDLLAVRGDHRLGVQCKDYRGTVGNDAVQQAYAGSRFHEMTEAIVVSPAKYTTAALKAGQQLGVKCIHHDQLAQHYPPA